MTIEFGHFALDGAGGLLHDSVFRPGAGGDLVLVLGQAEEMTAGTPRSGGLARLFHRFIHRKIEHARHGPDFLAHTLARADKQGVNKGFGVRRVSRTSARNRSFWRRRRRRVTGKAMG